MTSPLLQRTNAQPLSLELLREHVPLVQKGYEAHKRLRDEEGLLEAADRRRLLNERNKGTRAQEALIKSGLPLIRRIAANEFQRRRAWNSRVTYEEIQQEAIIGFIRGLYVFNVEMKDGTSPTNYLGQQIIVNIRRRIEAAEHDFAIPYETVERARRIKAVRSRLSSELGREPTDDELLGGLNSDEQYATGYKWGRVNVNGVATPKSGRKSFTLAHLEEAREVSDRAYAIGSQDAITADDEENSYERASTPLTVSETESQGSIEDRDLARARHEFFDQAFILMRMGSKQKDVILRFFGMQPYSHEQPQKEISSDTGYPGRFVKEVINAFSIYMPQQGGAFHKLLLETPADTIEDLELTWVLRLVGDWPKSNHDIIKPPEILTQNGVRIR